MAQAEPQNVGGMPASAQGVTVHLVGRLTPAVLSFLLPAIQASSSAGRRQALLYIDDGASHDQITALPLDVHRVRVPDSDSLLLRCASLFRALLRFSGEHPMNAVHVHGLLPALAAARLLRVRGHRDVEVVFSPHSSRVLSWAVARHAVLGRMRLPGEGESGLRVIANVQREARLLAPIGRFAVQVIDCPVPRAFFEVPRAEAPRPLVMSCNLEVHRAAFDGFQRAAVLLNDDRLGLDFHWLGDTAARGVEALRAAGVTCFDASSADARARRFGTAWVYVATCDERGFPIRLAEAMAAGLPCVALDTETHRNMVAHGGTGFLYRDVREMLERIGQLVDSETLRHRLGHAARREAERRFSDSVFQRRFWNAVSPQTQAVSGDKPDAGAMAWPPGADYARAPCVVAQTRGRREPLPSSAKGIS